jgi:glycosyltransferase involved in cell wall biosynthesis
MGRTPSAEQQTAVRALKNTILVSSEYKLEWMEDPWEDVAEAGEWLLELEDQVCPDIIHLNGYAHGDLPWKAPVVMVAHSCVYSWFDAVKGHRPADGWRVYRQNVIKGISAADCIVAPSSAMLRALRKHYGDLPNSTVIYNGISPAPLAEGVKKEPLILSAGRVWDAAKNIELLARCADSLSWPVYVAGETQRPGGHGVPPSLRSVRYLGPLARKRLMRWFQRAAIFALPARYEPFGLSALEAARSGCALVLGDIPSLREIWDGAACFVSPDDHRRLQDTLEQLSGDETVRSGLAVRGRKRATQLTSERMVWRYLLLYERICQSHVSDTAVSARQGIPA